jgi:predicted aspartyl protease
MRIRIAAFVVAALLVAAPGAAADETRLVEALWSIDVPGLRELAASSDTPSPERALAEGALAALHRNEEAAGRQLLASTEDAALSAELRRLAWLTLFNVRFREGRYQDAVNAMDAADALGAESDPARALSNAQARSIAVILADAPAMRVSVLAPGELPLRRDRLGLLRAGVEINEVNEEAVIDTGASFSVMSESRAERAGLRFLGEASAATASQSAVPFKLAVADRLVLADVTYENVVFAVYADEALEFLGGLYSIDAIIGLPVLIDLGRLEFRRDGRAEALRYGPSPEAPGGQEANLVLNGLNPLVLVSVVGLDAPLVMMLDTGSSGTGLTPLAGEDHPELLQGAREEIGTAGGIGGSVAANTQIIPQLELSIAGVDVPLRNVRVAPVARDARHGLIGQDVLSSGIGYVLDFQALRFELLAR